MVSQHSSPTSPETYHGQFGDFTITQGDRLGVIAYRGCLLLAALSFAAGVALILTAPDPQSVLPFLTVAYWGFTLALGGSLLLIHIYLIPLHRLLQLFWLVGSVSALVLSVRNAQPLLLTIYQMPLSIIGIGFTFAALTGIFFKEAFCFGRLETMGLTLIVPTLLLGHLFGFMPLSAEKGLLIAWAGLMVIFASRKVFQAIPSDIGDKSVFAYLKQKQAIAQQ
ncbi:MAG: DUF2301 domain-containing membrane protein [Leptolyngbyaceae bacterium]|nr:DUF2301 domain-containing membrane protein [Leptolyngbyaceae bacterium]